MEREIRSLALWGSRAVMACNFWEDLGPSEYVSKAILISEKHVGTSECPIFHTISGVSAHVFFHTSFSWTPITNNHPPSGEGSSEFTPQTTCFRNTWKRKNAGFWESGLLGGMHKNPPVNYLPRGSAAFEFQKPCLWVQEPQVKNLSSHRTRQFL